MNFRERKAKDKVFSVCNAGNFVYFSPKWFVFTVQCIKVQNSSEYADQETTPAFY